MLKALIKPKYTRHSHGCGNLRSAVQSIDGIAKDYTHVYWRPLPPQG